MTTINVAEVGTTVEGACREMVDIRHELKALTAEYDLVRERRHHLLKTLMEAYGKDMICRGQRTKKISEDYTLEAGLNPIHICACHRVYVRTCPDLTEAEAIEVIPSGFEPYIRVIFTGEKPAVTVGSPRIALEAQSHG
jgi:hypothetical protein